MTGFVPVGCGTYQSPVPPNNVPTKKSVFYYQFDEVQLLFSTFCFFPFPYFCFLSLFSFFPISESSSFYTIYLSCLCLFAFYFHFLLLFCFFFCFFQFQLLWWFRSLYCCVSNANDEKRFPRLCNFFPQWKKKELDEPQIRQRCPLGTTLKVA